MTDTMTEPQEQAADEEHERRARYGGTDLFRGVLVLVIAAAVGVLLVGQTPSSPRFLVDGDEEAADVADDLEAPTADASDTLDEESIDFSADEDSGLGAGSAMVDEADAMTGTEEADADSADILPDAADDDSDDSPGASVNPVGTEDTDTETDADSGTDTDTDGSTGGDDAMDDSAGRQPAEVTTIVLNHTTRKGIAGAETDKLDAAGYVTLPAANAATSSGSGVFYAEGYETEAEALATTLGLTTTGLVRPLSDPTAPTVASDVDLSSANIVIVLGKDGFIPAN